MPSIPSWIWPCDARNAREVDAEITEELQFHVDLLAEEEARCGRSPDDARRAAAERFGDFERLMRACRTEKQGDTPMLLRIHTALLLILVAVTATAAWRMTATPQPPVNEEAVEFMRALEQKLSALDAQIASASLAESPPAGSAFQPVSHEVRSVRRRADLTGVVVGPAGKPVANADVLLIVKSWPNNRFRQDDYAVKTDDIGAFTLKGRIPLDGQYGVNAAVVAEGHAVESRYVLVEEPAGQAPAELRFELSRSTNVRLVVTDRGGKPLPKALVAPSGRFTEADAEHLVYHQGSNAAWRKTDSNGAVTIDWFAPGDLGKVNVRPRGGEWQERKVEVDDDTETVIVEVDD